MTTVNNGKTNDLATTASDFNLLREHSLTFFSLLILTSWKKEKEKASGYLIKTDRNMEFN